MPGRRGATVLEDLPEEIIDMILVRLPSKDVGLCRAVSASWRSATSTSEFMREHHRRQPLLPIVNGRGRPASFVILRDADARPSSQRLWPFLPGARNHSKNSICATCDGYNGSLHWCPYFVGGGDINVFDTETESFRLMRCPTHTGFHKKLFNMNGTLAWVSLTISSTDIDVWVMEDYEAEIWAVKYRIDMLKVEASRQLYLSSSKKKMKAPLDSTMQGYGDIAVLNEHEVLIMFNNNLVLRCDIDGKFLGMVNIGKSQYCMKLTHHLLQESIIPIPSNEMQGEDGEPPLSTGHV